MSATNRGGKRKLFDFYETPEWVTRAIIPELVEPKMPALDANGTDPWAFRRVLEPAAGRGALIKPLLRQLAIDHLTAVELVRYRAINLCRNFLAHRVVNLDFRRFAQLEFDRLMSMHSIDNGDEGYDLIITNPPFCLAETYVERCLELLNPDVGQLALLLRLAFLEGKRRVHLHRTHPSDVFVLPKRPSFDGNGTDMAAYAWFVWGPGRGGRWSILDMPQPEGQLPPVFFDKLADATDPHNSKSLHLAQGYDGIIDFFRGEYLFLSNFYDAQPVTFEGIVYPTAEHAYQAAKFSSMEARMAVASINTPDKAKKAGRRASLPPDWEERKLDVMQRVLEAKFRSPSLRARLIATGNAELVEGNNWGDRYWGRVDGEGENRLGRMLMNLRARLLYA